MTDDEWERLNEGFETQSLLDAVGQIDLARDFLNDGDGFAPPELRTNTLRLHGLAMDVVNKGWTKGALEMFRNAQNLEDELDTLIEHLESARDTLSRLTDLFPDSLLDADLGDDS